MSGTVWLPRSRYSALENENQANTNGDAWGRNAILSSPFACFTKLILRDKREFWIDNENLLGVCVLNPHNANEQSLGVQHSHTMCCAFDQGTLPSAQYCINPGKQENGYAWLKMC